MSDNCFAGESVSSSNRERNYEVKRQELLNHSTLIVWVPTELARLR